MLHSRTKANWVECAFREALESHLIQDKPVLGVEVVVNVSDNIKQVTEQLVLQMVFPESRMS
jgi:hypothetical protein